MVSEASTHYIVYWPFFMPPDIAKYGSKKGEVEENVKICLVFLEEGLVVE